MSLFVLGMHRSGTSVLTRLLGLAGCYLGEEDEFNPTRPDNPKGDWERRDVWSINEAILETLGSAWDQPVGVKLDQLPPPVRQSLVTRTRNVVERLEPHSPWAIKDPRMCLTLGIWREAVAQPICILIHRPPLEVALSLKARDGFPLVLGIALWEAYTRALLGQTQALRCVWVQHGALFSAPHTTLIQLVADLTELGVTGLSHPTEHRVFEFFDRQLYRAQGNFDEQAQFLNPAQRSLELALRSGDNLVTEASAALSAAARDTLECHAALSAKLAEREARITALLAEREALAQKFERVTQQHEQRQAELQAHAALLEQLLAQLGDELRAGIGRANELESILTLILESKRWKIGDLGGELSRRLRLRPAETGAADHAKRIIGDYRDWRTRAGDRLRRPDELD